MGISVNIEQMIPGVRVFTFPFQKAGLNTVETRGPVQTVGLLPHAGPKFSGFVRGP
jgi:hypothetical protein